VFEQQEIGHLAGDGRLLADLPDSGLREGLLALVTAAGDIPVGRAAVEDTEDAVGVVGVGFGIDAERGGACSGVRTIQA